MSHGRHESVEHAGPWHNTDDIDHAVRDPPSHAHHRQNVQEYYIVRLTPQLPDCTCGVLLQFVPETNFSLPDATIAA